MHDGDFLRSVLGSAAEVWRRVQNGLGPYAILRTEIYACRGVDATATRSTCGIDAISR